MSQKLCLVDGNHLLFRSVFKGAHLRASNGSHTGGVYLFLKALNKMKELGDLWVIFDGGHAKFRKQLLPSYKQKNNEKSIDEIELMLSSLPPDNKEIIGLTEELNILKSFKFAKDNLSNLLTDLGIMNMRVLGYEADDILYFLAKKYCTEKEITVVSDDKDYFQFLNIHPSIKLYRAMHDQMVTYDKFTEEFGFSPEYFVYYKALMSDSSDNIPGIKGIGEVNAKKIIQGAIELVPEEGVTNFKECVYAYAESEPSNSRKKSILENKTIYERNLKLVDISKAEIVLKPIIEELRKALFENKPNKQQALQKFVEFEFRSLSFMLS